jgi:acetyltransferase-like isoleucine patch superfamily enzyme
MKTLIQMFLLYPVRHIRKGYFWFFNFIILKGNNVSYISFPKVNGKLIIINRGKLSLGRNLKFNSSIYSNLVGLYKPCSIEVANGAELIIGDYSGFSGVSIYCSKYISIGKNLFCGGNVSIWDTDFHSLNYKERRNGPEGTKNKAIKIGNDVFIGANSIILKGVEIGDRAVIGAGSVVTKKIGQDEIWAGNPCRLIS